jgi:hypothetical protein
MKLKNPFHRDVVKTKRVQSEKQRDKLLKIKATVDSKLEGINKTLVELDAKADAIKKGTPKPSVSPPPQYAASFDLTKLNQSNTGSPGPTEISFSMTPPPSVPSSTALSSSGSASPPSPPVKPISKAPLSEIEEIVEERDRTSHHTPRMNPNY